MLLQRRRIMKDERFIVTYRIEADTYEDAKSIAWAVQVEQTIEFPYEFRICNCGSDAECSD